MKIAFLKQNQILKLKEIFMLQMASKDPLHILFIFIVSQ